jgi:flavin reductase (DIM6/NTAB) family NADH-FMN oxidoreductase RutF
MNTWKPVRLGHASRLINHGPTVLVTTAAGGMRNVMAAAWSMPVELTPPRVAVVIDKKTHTWELVHASGAFALCIPGRVLADLTRTVGSVSGRDCDKFERYGIVAGWSPNLRVPVIETGCCAWLECRLIPEPDAEQAYDTCFAEVIAAAADSRIFDNGRWDFRNDNRDLHTLHHLGAGQFAVAESVVRGHLRGETGC